MSKLEELRKLMQQDNDNERPAAAGMKKPPATAVIELKADMSVTQLLMNE